MSSVFQLMDKQTGKIITGEAFIKLDEEVCNALNKPIDEVHFLADWVDRFHDPIIFKDYPTWRHIKRYIKKLSKKDILLSIWLYLKPRYKIIHFHRTRNY